MDGRITMDALVKYCSVYQSIQEVKEDFLARIKPYVTSASKVTGKNTTTIHTEKLKILNNCFTNVLGWGFGSGQVPNQAYYTTGNSMNIFDSAAGGSKKTLLDALPVKSVEIMSDATFQSRCLIKNLIWYDTNGNAKYTGMDGFHIRKYDKNGKMVKDYNIDFLIWKGNAKAAGEGDVKKETDFNVKTYAGLHNDGKWMVRVLATYLPYMIDNINEITGGELAIPPMIVRYEKQPDKTGKIVTLKDSSENPLPKRRALLWNGEPGNHSAGSCYTTTDGISYACRLHIGTVSASRWTSPKSGKKGSLYDIKNWGTEDAPASGFIRMCVRTSGTGAKEKIVDTKEVDYFCRSGRNYNSVTKLTSTNHELMHVLQSFWRNSKHTQSYMWDTEGGADLVNGGSKTLIQNERTVKYSSGAKIGYSYGYDLLYGRTIKNATVKKLDKNKKLIIKGYDADNNPVYETTKKDVTINFDFILRTDTSEDEYKAASIDGIGDYRYRAGCCLLTFLYRSVVNGWDQEWRQSHHKIKKDTAKAVAK